MEWTNAIKCLSYYDRHDPNRLYAKETPFDSRICSGKRKR